MVLYRADVHSRPADFHCLCFGQCRPPCDTIHNFGDASTAIPLAIAFSLARKKPSKCFSYGYGRVEDLAGVVVVLLILFSAAVAGYESVTRFLNPQPVDHLQL
jgi:divalent metal cation (Fe/Co/Zn/Cd) transporter